MRSATLSDFLTEMQLIEILAIYKTGGRAKEICEKVIQPNMAEINRKLGQENDAMYLAYACEYVLGRAEEGA